MSGIRVVHPTSRNVRYTVVDGTVPYPEPYHCTAPAMGGCGGTHLFKSHHLNLDDVGAAIVSEGVFERIKGRLILDGFTEATEVGRPPAIVIDTVRPGNNVPIVHSPSNPVP